MNGRRPPRLFLDSNVLTGGVVARWGLDKAVLSMCASHLCRMVLAAFVRDEVERNLLKKALSGDVDQLRANQLLSDYDRLLQLAQPELIALPDREEVRRSRALIRHAADVPVLLSASQAKPDWLLTHNTEHFTEEVARKTGLRIATPHGFLRTLTEASS